MVWNTLAGTKGKVDIAEEKLRNLDGVAVETIRNETERNKQNINELWDNFEGTNTHI